MIRTTALAAIGIAMLAAAVVAQTSVQRQVTSHPASDRCPRWSPDGESLAFESDRGGSWNLWQVRPDGSGLRPLTDSPADDRHPAWTPSGGRIVFVSDRGGEPDLWVLDLATKRARIVVEAPGRESFPDVSPDGRTVAFGTDRDGELQVWTVAVDGGTPRPLTRGAHRTLWPRWSPDGTRIAAFTRSFSDGEHDDVVLLDPAGGEPVRVTRAEGHDFCPTWAADGRSLAWIRIPPQGDRFLAVGGLDGRGRAMLGRGFERITEPDWARAGDRRIAYAVRSGTADYDLVVETAPRLP